MNIASSKVYEVLVRNHCDDTKKEEPSTTGIDPTLQIRDITIEEGTLIFEGFKEVLDPKDPNNVIDHLTFTKVDKAIDGLDIPIRTYGSLRAVASAANPDIEPREGGYNATAEKYIHKALYPEVLIVGSGPLGATYARKIVDTGHQVLMVEMGAQESNIVGTHKKNAVAFQKDIDSFVNVIRGDLSTLSVPVKHRYTATISPISWNSSKPFTRNGQNPEQDEHDNLGAAAATRCVGGMSTHWTCSTPRQHEVLERSNIFTDSEWNDLYKEAEGYLGTSRNQFYPYSIRDQLVKQKLEASLEKLFPNGREIKSLPLACKRNLETNPDLVTWAATDTVLGDVVKSENFNLLSHHHCTRVLYDKNSQNIVGATVKNLEGKDRIYVLAKKYVICGGSVLTPQILFRSGFRPVEGSLPALGHYLTEQTMSFCQIILKDEYVREVENTENPEWRRKIDKHKLKHPTDPLPFPFNEPDPQLTIPVSEEYPWHTQIHRDAFSYGEVAQSLDSRLVVDFRFFGMVEPEKDNRVSFTTVYRDNFGMPQPTFHFVLGEEAKERSHRMMQDMCTIATQIGGYLPGSEPQFMEPGLALHICGTTRASNSKKDSVVDKKSKVHDVNNLWLGGNNVIPTKNASNPTLTSMCFAIVGAENVVSELKSNKT